ncbi:DUF3094 family protein [Agaribacterium haliotis]|uniref:DUF3094 family protein n=1 Tax=Agaribacterium haliotis TaxID=2013869 RepID=UPI000BB59A1C|nr:DUF3094 family protein [Agaribacterium haliotis]
MSNISKPPALSSELNTGEDLEAWPRLGGEEIKEASLSAEDSLRVQAYLSLAQHRVERAPFRPVLLLLALLFVLVLLSLLSWWLAEAHGVV